MTDCFALYTCIFTSLENPPAKGQPPTTPNYMSNPNGHPHTGRSPCLTCGASITILHGSQQIIQNS